MTEFKNATESDRRAYAEAKRYLSRDDEAKNILAEIDKQKVTVNIVHDGKDLYHPGTRTVDWDPHSALAVQDEFGHVLGVQSAALGLLHEGAHATDHDLAKHAATPNTDYKNDAEAFAVAAEDRGAKILGETQRFNHFGKTLVEVDPTEHTQYRKDGSAIWVDGDGKTRGAYQPGTAPDIAPRASWRSFESGSDSPYGQIGQEMEAGRAYVRALQESRGGKADTAPSPDRDLAVRAAFQRGRD